MRYPLVDGQGNFGSIDGDPPAAMRYTEARMTRARREMLRDIDKETVDFVPELRRHARRSRRSCPARFPNLLVNGSTGIAVGMATNIPPHNLKRDRRRDHRAASTIRRSHVEDLMKHRQGPGLPDRRHDLRPRRASATRTRPAAAASASAARAHIETADAGKEAIVVTEMPYRSTRRRRRLIEKIAELVHDKKIDGITDLRDESDRDGMRIVVELKRDAIAEGRAEPALQAHAHAGHVRREHPRAGRRRAEDAVAARVHLALLHPPARGRHPPDEVRPAP